MWWWGGVWKFLLTLCFLAGKDFLEVSFPYWKEGMGKKIWVCLNCLRILTWDYLLFSTCFQVPEQQQVVGKKISNSITGNSIIETIPFITHIKRSFILQCPGQGMCHACYLSTWPGHWPFYYRRHFQIVPKKTGGCRQHGNSWSEWSFSLKKIEDNIRRVNASFQDYVAKIYDPVSVSAKSKWEQVGNYIFFYCLPLAHGLIFI